MHRYFQCFLHPCTGQPALLGAPVHRSVNPPALLCTGLCTPVHRSTNSPCIPVHGSMDSSPQFCVPVHRSSDSPCVPVRGSVHSLCTPVHRFLALLVRWPGVHACICLRNGHDRVGRVCASVVLMSQSGCAQKTRGDPTCANAAARRRPPLSGEVQITKV